MTGIRNDHRWSLLPEKQALHIFHIRLAMTEIGIKSLAKGILPAAVRPHSEPVLRTFSATGEIKPAAKALHRQGITLVQSELKPFPGHIYVLYVSLSDIAEKIFRVDKVVTRVDIPVPLDHQGIPAGLAH